MDILGKKGEEASEDVNAVADAVEDLNSHMNAIDNAVQHHDSQLDQIVENLRREEEFLEHIEDNSKQLKELRKFFKKFASVQSKYIERVDVLDSELSETNDNVSRANTRISKLENRQEALFDEVEDLKDRLNEIESEFILDTNRQEWDIESKLDESEFEERFGSHRNKVRNELSKLRTSINDISEKIDSDEIEIEK